MLVAAARAERGILTQRAARARARAQLWAGRDPRHPRAALWIRQSVEYEDRMRWYATAADQGVRALANEVARHYYVRALASFGGAAAEPPPESFQDLRAFKQYVRVASGLAVSLAQCPRRWQGHLAVQDYRQADAIFAAVVRGMDLVHLEARDTFRQCVFSVVVTGARNRGVHLDRPSEAMDWLDRLGGAVDLGVSDSGSVDDTFLEVYCQCAAASGQRARLLAYLDRLPASAHTPPVLLAMAEAVYAQSPMSPRGPALLDGVLRRLAHLPPNPTTVRWRERVRQLLYDWNGRIRANSSSSSSSSSSSLSPPHKAK
jgi:hypothetical protein